MSNERKDEFLSWRGRLDSPEGGPGQGLDDREQTWERLMDRLREKPRRRLPLLYGIAAACLLLVLIPATRLFHGGIATSHPRNVRPATPLVARPGGGSQLIPSTATGAPSPSPGDLTHRGDRKGAGRPSEKATGGRSKTSVPMEIQTAAVTNYTIHPLEAPAAPLVSQMPLLMPVIQKNSQKNWKVVDLNDLHAGWQAPHGMASNRPVPSFRIGFGNADPPGGATGGSSPPGYPGIRIKLSTPN